MTMALITLKDIIPKGLAVREVCTKTPDQTPLRIFHKGDKRELEGDEIF